MGIPRSRSLRKHTRPSIVIGSMKVLCILALAVAVSAEANHHLLYKSLLPTTTYVQKPLVYNTPVVNTYAKPVVYNTPVVQPLVYKQAVPQYQAHSAGVSHTVLKREAEADPQLLYGGYKTYGYPAVQPLVYNKPLVYSAPVVAPVVTPVKTYANDAVKPFNYAAKGQYIANSAGVVHVAKREAEADPQLLYKSILPATTYVQKPVVYQTPVVYKQPEVVYKQPEALVYKQAVPVAYKPVVYTKPVVYSAPVVAPVVTPVLKAKTYANDAEKPEDYAAKGMYHAENAGAVHIAKREADPYTIGYNTFQTSPTSFVSAPIVTAQQPAFYHTAAGLTTYSHLFKRDAEAEPEAEAEAEPWMTYGGYGYGGMPYMSVGTPYSPNYYVGMRRGSYYGSRYGMGNMGYYYGK